MKTNTLLAIGLTLWAAAGPMRAATETPAAGNVTATPMTVAVLPFDTTDEPLRGKGDEFATLLGAQLSTKPDLWMVERAEINKILSEQTIGLAGLTDPATATKVGQLLGARALVTGRIIHTGDTYVFVAKIMSTDTSRVFGAMIETTGVDSLSKPATDLATQVDEVLGKQAAVFNPPVDSYETRLARLKKLVEGKKLPSVQVKITEQEVTPQPSVVVVVGVLHRIDPAVETEFKKMLGDLGFEIVDASTSSKVPDVLITGEALTQEGARRDQLVSERARIEIQAKRPGDGKVLDVDRETGVAVDTAPAIAGKTALQNTADVLVERLVPKLLQP